jgi:hypothetical protein
MGRLVVCTHDVGRHPRPDVLHSSLARRRQARALQGLVLADAGRTLS